jgi:hypothetical protein
VLPFPVPFTLPNRPVISQDVCLYLVTSAGNMAALETAVLAAGVQFFDRNAQHKQPGRGIRFSICQEISMLPPVDTSFDATSTWILNNAINPASVRGIIVGYNPADGNTWCSGGSCSVVGWAKAGKACQNGGVMMLKRLWPVVIGHELGHMFGLPHEPGTNTIMEPIISGVSQVFTVAAQSRLTNWQVADWGTTCYNFPS